MLCCSVTQSCPTLCAAMDCSMPGFPVHHIAQSLLKLQYFGHLMQRTDSFEQTLILVKIEGGRRRGRQRMRGLDGTTDSMDMSLSKLYEIWWTGKPGMLQSMAAQRVGHDWVTEQQSIEGMLNTEPVCKERCFFSCCCLFGYVFVLSPGKKTQTMHKLTIRKRTHFWEHIPLIFLQKMVEKC